MGKRSKKSSKSSIPMPKAPWIYINDCTENHRVTWQLNQMLPSSTMYHQSPNAKSPVTVPELLLASAGFDNMIPIVHESYSDDNENLPKKLSTVNALRDAAAKCGSNFVSVNLYTREGKSTKKTDLNKWGTNHLEIRAQVDDMKDSADVAEKIYRWLFKILTPHETLHLIPDEEMRVKDDASFPDYAYCPISESKQHPKDAKIQFVAIILSRPVVGPDQKLTWQVADKTGVANFYFQYRGAGSQYTWDWVLGLQPGDRRALPRMPMVEIKERLRVKIVKAPFRGIGLAISGVGVTVRAVGVGVAKLGNALKMGPSSKWVPEGDVVDGKVVDWKKKHAQERALVRTNLGNEIERTLFLGGSVTRRTKVFNEKGEKMWKDDDSVASTEAGGDYVHVEEKEFA